MPLASVASRDGIRGFDIDVVDASRGKTASLTRGLRTAVTADAWPSSDREPLPVLFGFNGHTVVRVIKQLKDNLLVYRGGKALGDLAEFLRRATEAGS